MLIFNMTLLFFFASCALFQGTPSLKDKDKKELLQSVVLTGEGRGRLSFKKGQYVFSFESVLKENYDWILAVSIPLQGEEVMLFSDLRKKEAGDVSTESFEARIANEFKGLGLEKSLPAEEFLKEVRSLIRFHLGSKWGKSPNCQEQHETLTCDFEGETFSVQTTEKELIIWKQTTRGAGVVLEAKVLKDKTFERTDIRLYSNQENAIKKISSLSLELFWKN